MNHKIFILEINSLFLIIFNFIILVDFLNHVALRHDKLNALGFIPF